MAHVREAEAADASGIFALGNGVREFKTSDVTLIFWPETLIQDAIGSEAAVVLVAEDEGRLVGFLIANCNHTLSKALIENIYVLPEYRLRGIATRMLGLSRTLFEQRNLRFVSALAPPNDVAAIKAYEKSGYSSGELFLWLDLPVRATNLHS